LDGGEREGQETAYSMPVYITRMYVFLAVPPCFDFSCKPLTFVLVCECLMAAELHSLTSHHIEA
jgi:hypothetical protein